MAENLKITPSVIWIIICSFIHSLTYHLIHLPIPLFDNNAYDVFCVLTSHPSKEKLPSAGHKQTTNYPTV